MSEKRREIGFVFGISIVCLICSIITYAITLGVDYVDNQHILLAFGVVLLFGIIGIVTGIFIVYWNKEFYWDEHRRIIPLRLLLAIIFPFFLGFVFLLFSYMVIFHEELIYYFF